MKNIITILFLSFCITPIHAQKAKKALFIIADGIPADLIESLPHPNLDKIAAAGTYKRAYVGGKKGGYSQTPTISAVSYNSLLTGTWVNKHNVWGNDIKAPNYHYPTIFRLFQDQYPQRSKAIYSTWLDNRTKLVGEALPQTGYVQLNHVYDGYELDTIAYPHDKESAYIHRIDEKVVKEAARSIRTNAPYLSWVYLEYTDDMGHRFGTGERMKNAIAMLDIQVGKIWDAIRYREMNHNEDWLIIVTTDHGRDSVTGKNHGGQSLRERTTWLYTNARDRNLYFQQHEPAITDFLPTIAKHLSISIPGKVQQELDGVALTGPVSIAHANAVIQGDSVVVTWKSFEKNGNVKIQLASSDLAKEGKDDSYTTVAQVPADRQRFAFVPTIKNRSGLYKIVIRGRNNMINTRVLLASE